MSDDFVFTPKTVEGRRPPLYSGKKCHGKQLTEYAHNFRDNEPQIQLSWIIDARKQLADDEKFFNNYFIKLAGTSDLQEKINSGMSEDEIRSSWRSGIEEYLVIRAKYLLY